MPSEAVLSTTDSEHRDPDHFDVDVLVVGAGPIGLTTAAALGHHGVSCRVVEQRDETKPYSRANNVWARAQELLDGVGVRDALAANSYLVTEVRTVLGGRPIDPVLLDRVPSPFPAVLYSGQDVIETTLTDLVAGGGTRVERGRKLVDLHQDDDGVTATVVPSDDHSGAGDGERNGTAQRIRCRYLVGADGSSGAVRDAVGVKMPTDSFEGRLNRQVDARLSWARSTEPDHISFFYYDGGFAGILPVWGGYHRLFFLQGDEGVPDRDPTLEEIQALAREVTQDPTLTLTDPVWFSHSRFRHGVADSYAVGRVLLAGDAGHFTLPIGGQGMNAGFHDAVGVAWRLAMVLAGRAAPVVLTSYGTERQGEHARLHQQQVSGFRRTVERGKVTDVAIDLAARVLPGIGSLIQGTDDLQQLSVAYPGSELNDDHLGPRLLHRGAPRAGRRAPDAPVSLRGGEASSLFVHTTNPDGWTYGWTLLAFDGGAADEGARRAAAIAAVEPWAWIRPRLVSAVPLPPAQRVPGVTDLMDLDQRAHDAYDLRGRPALVLLRPDGHIAFRGPVERPELLTAYCERIFGSAPHA